MGAHTHKKSNNRAAARSNQPKRPSKKFNKKADHVEKGRDTGARRRG